MSIIYLNEAFLERMQETRDDPKARCNCCKDWCDGRQAQITIVIEPGSTSGRVGILCARCKYTLEKICDRVADGQDPEEKSKNPMHHMEKGRRH